MFLTTEQSLSSPIFLIFLNKTTVSYSHIQIIFVSAFTHILDLCIDLCMTYSLDFSSSVTVLRTALLFTILDCYTLKVLLGNCDFV